MKRWVYTQQGNVDKRFSDYSRDVDRTAGLPSDTPCLVSLPVINISTMTKADLIENVRVESGLSKKEAVEIVESVLAILKETLSSGAAVKVSGFGKFYVTQKSNRNGRNPQTGESLTINARKVLTFKPSTLLKQKINKD